MSFCVYDRGRFIHYLKLRRRPVIWLERLEARVLWTTVGLGSPVTTNLSDGLFPVATTAVGDLNGDGIPDLVANRTDDAAQVYLGTATGAFTLGQTVDTGGAPIALGNFTAASSSGVSNLDLVTANGVLPGHGDGTFGTAIAGFTLPANTVDLYAQDINPGDGLTSLVASTFIPANTQNNPNPILGIDVLIGNGNGTFKSPVITQVGTAAGLTSASANYAFGDFNNDGRLDVLTPFGLMPGNGNGSFGNPVPLPFPGASPTAVNSSIYLVDDFNGDGNLDVVTLPPTGSAGQIDVFLGNGSLGFAAPTTITVSAGSTITSLAAADMTGSGNEDLLVGLSNPTTNVASVALLLNSGNGTFAAPSLYTLPGAPLQLTAQAFTSSGNPDLLAIEASAGTPAGTVLAEQASVLLNSQAAGLTPTLALSSSENPAIAGDAIHFSALVQAPSGSTKGVPTGNVTFYNAGSPLGTVALKNGKAVLNVSATGVGVEDITFSYSGDANYDSATSAVFGQIVLASAAKQPLIIPSISAVTLPNQFLPGDRGAITFMLTNGGNASAQGRVAAQLYLSSDGAIDSASIPIQAPTPVSLAVQLGRGRSGTFTMHFIAGAYPAGVYHLIAQLAPATKFTNDEVSSAPATATGTFQALGRVFGSVGVHHGLVLKAVDGAGDKATLSMAGPGYGTLTTASDGELDIALAATSSASAVTVASHGAFNLGMVTDRGVLGALSAGRTTLTTQLALTGGATKVTFASVDGTGRVSLTIGAASPVTLALGAVNSAVLKSSTVIKSLSASSWSAGAIDAPAISNLSISGALGADVNTHDGGAVQTARIGALTGGTWAIAGAIASLRVLGNVTDASIFVGADSGPDNILGTSDDAFAAATIGSINIGGAVADSLFIAGGSFPIGSTPSVSTLTALLAKSAIRQISVRGAIDSTSLFLAAKLPAMALLDGAHVKTKTDPHFSV